MSTAMPQTDPEFPCVVFGDFICPWSFSVIPLVDRLCAEYGLRPWWRPHLLYPETPLEGTAIPDTGRREATHEWLKETAPDVAARLKLPERLQHTFLAFQALEFAQDRGKAWPFKSAVFDAIWLEGSSPAHHETLAGAAESVGLDGAELVDALRAGTYVGRTLGAAAQARKLGITATPTLMLGRTRIDGWHYYEVLQEVVEKQGRRPVAA